MLNLRKDDVIRVKSTQLAGQIGRGMACWQQAALTVYCPVSTSRFWETTLTILVQELEQELQSSALQAKKSQKYDFVLLMRFTRKCKQVRVRTGDAQQFWTSQNL